MANITKRGNSYRINVSVGYDTNGQKLQVTTTYKPELYTATGKPKAESVIQKEVERYAIDFENQVKSGAITQYRTMRFHELVERYLQEYAFIELETHTAEDYKNHLEKKIIPAFGHYRIDNLCKAQLDIQKFYNKMAEPTTDGKKLAVSSIKRSICVFSSVMRWATDMKLADSNPLERIRPPKDKQRLKPKESKVKNFTIDELARFVRALDTPQIVTCRSHHRVAQSGTHYDVPEYNKVQHLHPQFKLFFILAAFSGCRRGELIALDWEDIDFKESTIHIYKSASKTSQGIIIKSTKTESGVRILNMPQSVMSLLKDWHLQQTQLRFQLGTAWEGTGNIFCQSNGSRMYPDTVSAKFRDIIVNWNAQCKPDEVLPEIPLHGLRHTAASILIHQHTDIATVSKRLGHSSTSVTLDIYTHSIKEADRVAADKLESIAKITGVS